MNSLWTHGVAIALVMTLAEDAMGKQKEADEIVRVLFGSLFGIPFQLFVRVLRLLGFLFVRQKGSHAIYRHSKLPEGLTVQPDHNQDAKPYQVKQLRRLNAKYRWREQPGKSEKRH